MRPYPETLITEQELEGIKVKLRPIKPEDEPMWLDMLNRCSRESIYARFRYFFNWDTHEVASRYCFIDYDREIAIVAEIETEKGPQLIAVGRLVADPDVDTVEYALLIVDEWQNRGLGNMITEYCLDIAKDWGLRRIIAQTTSDNKRMISVFEKFGFKIKFDAKSDVVDVEKLFGQSQMS
jgi:acetyltransferase